MNKVWILLFTYASVAALIPTFNTLYAQQTDIEHQIHQMLVEKAEIEKNDRLLLQ